MSVEVLYDSDKDQAVLVCNTTDTAFGPVFNEISKHHGWSAAEVAENFLRWLVTDARLLGAEALSDAVSRFIAAEPRECYNYGCEQPATLYDVTGLGNRAYDRETPFCSEECRDAYSEEQDERQRDAYYGASTPQTDAERLSVALQKGEKS